MRTEELGTYEMLWDCPFCGTPKLLGLSHRHCPNCGGAQDPQFRYYPSDQDKVAVQNHYFAGADLVCPACSTPNSARANNCGGCGSPLQGAKQAAARHDQTAAQGQAFGGESIKDAKSQFRAERQAQADAAAGRKPVEPTQKKSGISGLKIGLIVGGIFVVLAAAVVVLFVWKKEVGLTADGHSWERSIAVEKFKAVSGSDWCKSMPHKAYSVTKKKEKSGSKKIKDGEVCKNRRKDNRDGTFKQVRECKPKYRSEPIYDMKCYYKIDKWTEDRRPIAKGSGKEPEPTWPKVELKKKGSCKGCERQGSKSETYTIHYVDEKNEETHDCKVDLDKWKAVEAGSKWKAKVGVVTTALDCDSLEPAG